MVKSVKDTYEQQRLTAMTMSKYDKYQRIGKPAPRQSTICRWLRYWMMVPTSLCMSGCLAATAAAIVEKRMNISVVKISGAVKLLSSDGNSDEWKPDRCFSGDAKYMYGFDLSSSTDNKELRIVEDPLDGPAARWTDSSVVILRKQNCSRLILDLQSPDFINDVHEFNAHIDFACSAQNGLTIEGHLDVQHCHY